MEEVNFTTSDGVEIAANLFGPGDGDMAVLLLPMGKGKASNNSQKDWFPFARYLAEQGYTALTLDFRGRGGSGGEFGNDLLPLDVQAALQYLQERGFERVVCVGAGMGGTTCIRLTVDGVAFEGLVILGMSLEAGPTNKVSLAEVSQIDIPKLYFYAENENSGFIYAMEEIYAASHPPKEMLVCPDTAAHGTEMLNVACGEEIRQKTLSFLRSMLNSQSEATIIEVPSGNPVSIDGSLLENEWEAALKIDLENDAELWLSTSTDYLFLGLRSPAMSYGSICLAQGDQISILHSSAALGTAIYEKGEAGWVLTRDFSWCCRSYAPHSESDAHFETEGWIASTGGMGLQNEMEYQISLDKSALTLAVVFQDVSGQSTVYWWPENLEDGCLDLVKAGGTLPESLQFSPETWMRIVATP